MYKYNKIKILRQAFDAAPLWPFGASDPKSCAQLIGAALADAGNRTDDNDLVHCAVSLADWAWQFYPLDGEILPLLAFLQESGADFGPASQLIATLAGGAAAGAVPLSGLENPAHSAAALRQAWPGCCAALLRGEDSPAEELLHALSSASGLPELPALTARLRAETALLRQEDGEDDALFELLATVDDRLFGAWKAWQLGRVALRRGDKYGAASHLAGLRSRYFWHPNLTLILHDLANPLPAMTADHALPAILLYSWNKCDALRTTLESLRASGTGAAPVFVLDNGSTDGTGEMLRAMKDAWGTPFTLISLPANVGAPAARNWLLSLPEVRGHTHAAFLDDDVILPEGWLQELTTVALTHPKAGAVGCAVTDHIPPFGIQAADFHLLSPAEGLRSFVDQEENIFPFCQALGQHDTFAFHYTRPCASVTGCCHLLSMRSVAEIGTFDVRFNPSQFDDLERDLRLGRQGWEVYFHGPLVVRHMQHSSLRQALTVRQQAHIMGNRLKLEYLFTAKEAAALRQTTRLRIEEDLLRKCAALDKILGDNPAGRD